MKESKKSMIDKTHDLIKEIEKLKNLIIMYNSTIAIDVIVENKK